MTMKTVKLEKINYVSETEPGKLYANGQTAEGVEGAVALTDARGAISPPIAGEAPGYWLLLGTRYGVNDKGKQVRMFLKEGQSNNYRRLIDDLVGTVGKYRAREIYCSENTGLYSTLAKKLWSVQDVSVRPAPHEADIDFGISLIIEALEDDALEIPRGTILRGQLEQMSKDDLGYTLPALRGLLGGFSLFHPLRTGSMTVKRANYYYG